MAEEGGEVEVSEPRRLSQRTLIVLVTGIALLLLLAVNSDEQVMGFLICVGFPVAFVGLFVSARHPHVRMRRITLRVPALVVGQRVEGGSRTVNHATLQGEDGERQEHRISAKLAGRIAAGDVGIASFADRKFVDFRRFDA